MCWLCLRNKTRRWLKHYRRSLREEPVAILLTIFVFILAFEVILAGILTLVLGVRGWQ